MNIRYELETGWPSQTNLHRRVSAFTRSDRARGFKIGITNNPEVRSQQQDYRSAYDEMVVIYKTNSIKFVRNLERFLTDYHELNSDNVNRGGGGNYGTRPYYLYIVVKR